MILDAGVLIPPAHAPARIPETRPSVVVLAPYRHPVAEVPENPLADVRGSIARARAAIARCMARLEEDDSGAP